MGVAIIGGLLTGTALTLYVVPAVYSYLSREVAEPQAVRTGVPVERHA
jgi:multidrug efflux pump